MSLFSDQGDNTDGNWLDRVVADKGEKFRDPEELAKSLFHANMQVKTLEDEAKELRGSKATEDRFEELLKEIRNQRPTSGEGNGLGQSNASGADGDTTQTGPEDIKKLVEEALTEREKSRTRDQNIAQAEAEAVKLFGDSAAKEVEKRASELGISKEQMADIAAQSPSAFLRMLGQAPAKSSNNVPDSSVNTANFTNTSERRNWNYYQKLRKENPKLYRTPQVQRQMEQDYASMGSDYWN